MDLRYWLTGSMLLTLLFVIGCSGEEPISQAKLDAAKAGLEKGFESWKKGDPAKKWNDPDKDFFFYDSDWNSKHELVSYEIKSIEKDPDPEGDLKATVTVEIRKRKQKTRRLTKFYGIGVDESGKTVKIGSDSMM